MKKTNKIRLLPSKLQGTINVPASKSISHRSLISGALAKGETVIRGGILSDDVLATVEALRALGSRIDLVAPGALMHERGVSKEWAMGSLVDFHVKGNPPGRLDNRNKRWEKKEIYQTVPTIDCRESATTLRLLIPLSTLYERSCCFIGRGRLADRPLEEYYRIFDREGIPYKNTEGKLPLMIEGSIGAGTYYMQGDVSSQFISGLMMALPLLQQDSRICLTTPLESSAYVELTRQVLADFGVWIEKISDKEFAISGNQCYRSRDYILEGDFSQAAFWLVAGVISPYTDNRILCTNLNVDSLQGDRQIVDILTEMGGKSTQGVDGLQIRSSSRLKGLDIDGTNIPDLIPILAVTLSVSQGYSRVYGIKRLRLKESDRLSATVRQLSKLGADIREVGDEIHICGQPYLRGGTVDACNDHRIAMAMAVAATVCKQPVTLFGYQSVAKSYPHFFTDYQKLGGNIVYEP